MLTAVALGHVHQDILDSLDVRRLAEEFAARSDIRSGLFGKTKLLQGFTNISSDYFLVSICNKFCLPQNSLVTTCSIGGVLYDGSHIVFLTFF